VGVVATIDLRSVEQRAILAHRYTLQQLIAERPCGRLSRAEDAVSDDDVYVLMLSSSFSNPQARAALERLASPDGLPVLDHPCIRAMQVVSEDEGGVSVVYASEGDSLLSEQLEQRPPLDNWLAARALVLEVGEALAHAHDRGWIHGALSPASITLSPSDPRRPQIHVHDIGLAGIAESAGDPHLAQWRARSPYTAPELLAGGRAHPRADIYALGMLLWELAAGRAAFNVSDLPLIDAERRRGTLAHSDCPPELEAVLDLALAPDPSERFADIHEFVDTLRALADPDDSKLTQLRSGLLTPGLLASLSRLDSPSLRQVQRHIDALLARG